MSRTIQNINANTISVDTTVGGVKIVVARPLRGNLALYNNGSATVFIGTSGVTTGTGFPLAAGASLSLDDYVGAPYGITAAGSSDVRFVETF